MIGRRRIVAGLLVCGFVVALVTPEIAAAPTDESFQDVSVVVLSWAVLIVGGISTLLYQNASRFAARLRSFGPVEHSSDTTAEESESESGPSPPLSDEELVLQLLEDNDGQLPQSEVVGQTPWSKSKVSRLLARMDVQSQVVKINVGRQNIIVLPEAEPAEVKPSGDREPEKHR